MQKQKLIFYLLLPIGIIGVPVISLVIPLIYTPDTSVSFPYIPPPPNGYYIETSNRELTYTPLTSSYLDTWTDINDQLIDTIAETHKGESFIFKNISITDHKVVTRQIQPYILGEGLASPETETFLMSGNVQFVPQDPSQLKELKAGDVVDIIGVLDSMSEEWPGVLVMKNCQFLPAGIAPLPLPGGPAVVSGGY